MTQYSRHLDRVFNNIKLAQFRSKLCIILTPCTSQCHHFSATDNHYTGDKYWCWYNLALVENGKEGNICWCRMLREDFEQIRRGLAGHQLTGNYWGRSERFGRVDDIVHHLNHQQGWGTNTCCRGFKFDFYRDHVFFVREGKDHPWSRWSMLGLW